MSIFPSSHAQAEALVITKVWVLCLIHPFLHLSASVLSILKPFMAGNRWSHVLHLIKKPERQFRPFSASTAASVDVCCSACLFPGHQKNEAVSCLRKPFLEKSGSAEEVGWPSMRLRSEIRGEWKEEQEDTYVISNPRLPSVTRALTQEALELHYHVRTADEEGASKQQADDNVHQTLQLPSCISNGPYLTTVTRYLSAPIVSGAEKCRPETRLSSLLEPVIDAWQWPGCELEAEPGLPCISGCRVWNEP